MKNLIGLLFLISFWAFGAQVSTNGIKNDAITGAKIRLNNNEYLKARNFANNANVSLFKVNASDQIEASALPYFGGFQFVTTSSGATTFIPKSDFTTKGQLICATGSGTYLMLSVGTDTFCLVADSTQTCGVKWASCSTGSGDIKSNGTVPFAANESMGGFKLTNLGTPTVSGDAATKAYVDSAVGSGGNFAITAVDLVSTNSLTLSGEQTIDGVLTSASRVLLTFQSGSVTDPANGVYLTAAGAWSRVTDMDASAEFYSGMMFQVRSGTVWGKSRWFLDTANPITLGVTGLGYLPSNVTTGSVASGGFRITNTPGDFAGGQGKQWVLTNNTMLGNSVFTLSTATNQATATLKIPSVSGITDELLTIKSGQTGIVDKRFDGDSSHPNRTFNWYYPDPETFGPGFGGDPGADGAWNATFFTAWYPSFRKGNNQGVNHFAERHLAVATVGTTNITLSGEQTINGVLTSGSRVLLTAQSTASQNGLWKTAAGAWQRPGNGFDSGNVDADGNISFSYFPGLEIYVNSGDYSNTTWTLTTTAPITLGTTALSFTESSVLYYESAASTGGSGTETLTVTGLASTDDIISVSQRVPGANSTAVIGWANQAANSLDVTWTANPGANAIVRVGVRKR